MHLLIGISQLKKDYLRIKKILFCICKIEELKVFPNPFTTRVRVQLPNCIQDKKNFEELNITTNYYNYGSDAYLEVLDLNGKRVKMINLSEGQKELRIPTEGWLNGIYLLRLLVKGNIVSSVKVVKSN
ncbi:MAG: T9SS type A sorting domain-containing protein [Bacteroidales bacterium]